MEDQTQTITRTEDPTRKNGVDSLNRELSEALGVEVYARDARWLKYAEKGVVVDLSISRERFKLQLDLEMLGIEPADPEEAKRLRQFLAPGHRYLLPLRIHEEFEKLDSRARYRLEKWSYATFWGAWVPLPAFAEWLSAHREVEGQFALLLDKVEEQYDDLKKETLTAFLGFLQGTHDRLKVLGTGARLDNFADKDAWVQGKLDMIAAEIPTVQTIRTKLKIKFYCTSLPDLARVERDRVAAGDIRLTEAERIMLDEVERTASEKAGKGVSQFVEEVRVQLQTQVFDAVSAALKVAQDNDGKLDRNSSTALSKFLKQAKLLDFWDEGNGSLQARLASLQGILDQPSQKRSAEELKGVLTTLGAEARLSLMEMDKKVGKRGSAVMQDVGLGGDVEELQSLLRRESAAVPSDLFDDDDDSQGLDTGVRQAADVSLGDEDDDSLEAAGSRQAVGIPTRTQSEIGIPVGV